MPDPTPPFSRRRFARGLLVGGFLGAAGLAAPAAAEAAERKKKVKFWPHG